MTSTSIVRRDTCSHKNRGVSFVVTPDNPGRPPDFFSGRPSLFTAWRDLFETQSVQKRFLVVTDRSDTLSFILLWEVLPLLTNPYTVSDEVEVTGLVTEDASFMYISLILSLPVQYSVNINNIDLHIDTKIPFDLKWSTMGIKPLPCRIHLCEFYVLGIFHSKSRGTEERKTKTQYVKLLLKHR